MSYLIILKNISINLKVFPMQVLQLVQNRVEKCSIPEYKEFRFLYPQRLVDCMVTYNYILNPDKSSRSLGSSSTDTIDDNQEVDIEIQSDDLDIERIELHKWLTDSENSDLSNCN